MRLDKFLKITSIIKRRTIAALLCNTGKITVNGQPGKASREISTGNQIAITLPNRILEVEVLAVPKEGNLRKSDTQNFYKLLKITDLRSGTLPAD